VWHILKSVKLGKELLIRIPLNNNLLAQAESLSNATV